MLTSLFTLLKGQDEASSESVGEKRSRIKTSRALLMDADRELLVKKHGLQSPNPCTQNRSEKGGIGS